MSLRHRMPLILLALVIASFVAFLWFRSGTSKRPAGLGVHSGRLSPCPDSPNCVCSFAEDTLHAIEPIAFSGDGTAEWQRLQQALRGFPRTVIVTAEEDYLHAEFTSLIFRFVDDVELFRDRASGKIHIRSASRMGHSDLGVNRDRLEWLRQQSALR